MKWSSYSLAAVTVAALSLGACSGCRTTSNTGPATNGSAAADTGAPSLRLYVLSDLAGALEPCGCVKDQLGGMDHFAAYVGAERAKAPASVVLAAGPLFFMDPTLKEDRRTQDVDKAQTIAASLNQLGLAAFAPGKNDWAAGASELERLRATSGGSLVAANVAGGATNPAWAAPVVREINGVKLGVFGVTAPDKAEGGAPADLDVKQPEDVAKEQAAALKKQGAQVVIALAAVGRGQAKRIADLVPDLTAVVVGSPGGAGESNTEAPPAERLGNVLVLETGNHLQTVAVLDLFVRDGSTAFADASGLELERKRSELTRRIDELRGRIAQWDKDGKGNDPDLQARRADVERLEKERAALGAKPPPASGSFFRYQLVEMRDSLGKDKGVEDKMLAYYKHVNDANKTAFASRKPPAPAAGEPTYVGVESCTTCHEEARAVWDKTKHAKAYATLSTQFKEFNLDCVSCHVTGYDRPGGSTVTHVEKLANVQCEVCHGPGSKHSAKPDKVEMPIAKPKPDQCLACHHPPHVHEFHAETKMAEILGPGHGKPEK